MELGDAFKDFLPELRTQLRDAAAREDGDARAKGEQEAEALYRTGRLADINTTLKAKADAGEIPHRLVPAYYQGAAFRYGIHAADTLNAGLLKTVNEAASKGNAEDTIKGALTEAAAQINPADTYARAGFDQASREVVNSYRLRVAQQAAHNNDQQAEYQTAQAGYRSVSELASAPADQVEGILQTMKGHLDARRGQIDPTAVNGEFLKNSVIPAVSDLFAQKRFEEAHQLISRLRTFDVVGDGGGMFGQIADVSYQLNTLEQQAIKQGEAYATVANENLKRDLETAQLAGNKFATDTIEGAKGGGHPMLPSDIPAAVAAWAKNLPASADKAAYTRAATKALANELNSDTAARRALHASEVGAFMSKMTSLKPDDIARYEACTNAVEGSDIAAPAALQEIRDRISSLKARSGLITDRDSTFIAKNLFPSYALIAGTPPTVHPTFSPSVPGAAEAWEALDQDARGNVQLAVNSWAIDRLRDLTGAFTDMKEADAEMPKLREKVVQEAQVRAAHDALNMVKAMKKQDARGRAYELAKNIRLFNATDTKAPLALGYESETKDESGRVIGVSRETYPLPGKLPHEPAYKTVGVLPSERDAATVRTRGFTRHGNEEWVDLPAVAKDLNQTEDPARARKALELYAAAKARLGFTPDEVLGQVTKHGVRIVAKDIDPRFIAVFRSVTELEDAWNGGAPKPLFFQLRSAVSNVDPKNPLRASDFYSAQMALLKRSR